MKIYASKDIWRILNLVNGKTDPEVILEIDRFDMPIPVGNELDCCCFIFFLL